MATSTTPMAHHNLGWPTRSRPTRTISRATGAGAPIAVIANEYASWPRSASPGLNFNAPAISHSTPGPAATRPGCATNQLCRPPCLRASRRLLRCIVGRLASRCQRGNDHQLTKRRPVRGCCPPGSGARPPLGGSHALQTPGGGRAKATCRDGLTAGSWRATPGRTGPGVHGAGKSSASSWDRRAVVRAPMLRPTIRPRGEMNTVVGRPKTP